MYYNILYDIVVNFLIMEQIADPSKMKEYGYRLVNVTNFCNFWYIIYNYW